MIFIIEDDLNLRELFRDFFLSKGNEVETFPDAETALEAAKKNPPDVAVSDLQLPGMSGADLLEELGVLDPAIIRILMTAHTSVQDAVKAIQTGYYDYLEKPVDLQRLERLVQRALAENRTNHELAWLRNNQRTSTGLQKLIGTSPAIKNVQEKIETLSKVGNPTPPVLVVGETGVGKSLIAQLIHYARHDEDAPWIALNCAALPGTLIESELFGYEKNAFTDAKQAKTGLFEAATGGTIFLDEIGELPLELQSKLLHVVESGTLRRLGSLRSRTIQTSIIAASNRDLAKAAKEGSFRADLFHRLAAFTIEVPPLRDRGNDVLLLAEFFLGELAIRYRKNVKTLSPDACEKILQASWPGNIRELRFAIERAVIQLPTEATALSADHLPGAPEEAATTQVHQTGPDQTSVQVDPNHIKISIPDEGVAYEKLEKAILAEALKRTHGNVAQAARLLDLKRDALRYRIQKFGLMAGKD